MQETRPNPDIAPTNTEDKKLKRVGTTLDQYLDGYKAASAPEKQNRSKGWENTRRHAPKPARRRKKRFPAALAVLLFVAVLAASFSVIVLLEKQPVNTQDKDVLCTQEFTKYVEMAERAAKAAGWFKTERYNDSSVALSALSEMINSALAQGWTLNHTENESFATGKTDPWGTPYYITAKEIPNMGAPENRLFDFYIVSAGENGKFDTESFVLDRDDCYQLLISMADYAELSGDHSFVDPEETTPAQSAPYANVPLTFDMCGGSIGTSFIEVTPGGKLPAITPPEMDGFVFTGYYEFPNGVGVRYFDNNGNGTMNSPFTTGTTLYAAWEIYVPAEDPVVEETAEPEFPDENGEFPEDVDTENVAQ